MALSWIALILWLLFLLELLLSDKARLFEEHAVRLMIKPNIPSVEAICGSLFIKIVKTQGGVLVKRGYNMTGLLLSSFLSLSEIGKC